MSDISAAVEAAGRERLQVVEEKCPDYRTGRVEEFSAFAEWGVGHVVVGSYKDTYCARTGDDCNLSGRRYEACKTYLGE